MFWKYIFSFQKKNWYVEIKYIERCARFSVFQFFFSQLVIRISIFSYFSETNTVKRGSIIRVVSVPFGSHEQTEFIDGIDSDEFGFDWSNGSGNVLFAAATRSWQCNQRLFLYRFCIFPIFSPFRLSVDAFVKSFKLARSLSNRMRR